MQGTEVDAPLRTGRVRRDLAPVSRMSLDSLQLPSSSQNLHRLIFVFRLLRSFQRSARTRSSASTCHISITKTSTADAR